VRFHELHAEQAVEVTSLAPHGAASEAGLRQGDLIAAINDEAVTHVDDLYHFLTDWPPGERLTLTVLRRIRKLTFSVRPADAGAAMQP